VLLFWIAVGERVAAMTDPIEPLLGFITDHVGLRPSLTPLAAVPAAATVLALRRPRAAAPPGRPAWAGRCSRRE